VYAGSIPTPASKLSALIVRCLGRFAFPFMVVHGGFRRPLHFEPESHDSATDSKVADWSAAVLARFTPVRAVR